MTWVSRWQDATLYGVMREGEKTQAPLPCPFCGFAQPQVDHNHGADLWILCPGCGARTGQVRVYPVYDPDARARAEREAWDEWQTRYTPEGERER